MGRFLVKDDTLREHISELQEIEASLGLIQSEILMLQPALSIQSASVVQLKSNFSKLVSATEEQECGITSLRKAATEIADICIRTETSVKEKIEEQKAVGAGAVMGTGVTSLFEQSQTNGISGGIDKFVHGSDTKHILEWNDDDDNVRFYRENEAFFHGISGKVDIKFDDFSGSGEINAFNGTASSAIYAEIMEDGNFNPKVGVKGEAKGNILEGDISGQIGNEEFNTHGELEGVLVGGEASGEVSLGDLGEDEKGRTKYGLKVSGGAEAYLAKGEARGGFTIFGIDVDYVISGKAGAAGIKAGGEISNQGIYIDAGLAALLGLEGEVSIDWSKFELPEFDWLNHKL